MQDTPDLDDLLSLDDAARLIPGATADTLKRLARGGKLTVYRVGKRYATTRADLDKAIKVCRVEPKVRVAAAPDMAAASAALDAALAAVPHGASSTKRGRAALELAQRTSRELKARFGNAARKQKSKL